jgi:hypothetical protein
MRCKRAKGYLALLAGGDLPSGRAEKVSQHIESCPDCRNDYREYQVVREQAGRWFVSNRITWQGNDWDRALSRATSEERPLKRLRVLFKPRWVLGAIGSVILLVGLLLLQPGYRSSQSKTVPVLSGGVSDRGGDLHVETTQEIISVTIISKESGLKINWFFNKNFKEEEIQ